MDKEANISEKLFAKAKPLFASFENEPIEKVHNPKEVILVCDATFYGKRKNKLGTLVFKDADTKEILIWKHIQSEKIADYKYLLQELLILVYKVKSITIDGKRGLYRAFQRNFLA